MLLQLPLLQGRVLDRHPKEALAALQGGRFRHAASSAAQLFRLVAGASPPNVLHSLGLQATQAAAVMALPVPGGSPDNHVADDGRPGPPATASKTTSCSSRRNLSKGPSAEELSQTSAKTASPHCLLTREQHSQPLRKATQTGSADLQGRARCMCSLTWA
jgi:hypothetical protein